MKRKGEPRAIVGIRLKLLLFVTACVLIIITIQTVVMMIHDRRRSRFEETRQLLAFYYSFKDTLSLFEKASAAVAGSFALRRDLKALVLEKDRDEILDLLLPAYTELNATVEISHLVLHDADGAVLAAVHRPSEDGEPDAAHQRLLAVALEGKKTVQGIELYGNRLSVMAVAPIFDREILIGLVAAGMNLDRGFWENQSTRTNLEYRVWAATDPAGYGPDAGEMAPGVSFAGAFSEYADTASAYSPLPESIYSRMLEKMKPEVDFVENGDSHLAVLLAPLIGHENRLIGVLEMMQSREAALSIQREGHAITLVAAVGIAVIGLILLWFVVHIVVLQPLGHLVEIASRQLKGDPDARVTLLPPDEFGQLGRIFNILSSQLSHTLSTQKNTIGTLQKTQDMLKSSEEKFREITELLPETIFESDPSGKLRFVNQNAFDHFGYSQEDVADGLEIFQFIAPEDRERARRSVERILDGGSVGLKEIHAQRKDGATFPAIFHATPIVREGVPVGYRGFIIDVTETKQLENQLHHSQKMEAIGRLAGGVAHDFNNLLSPILGYSELLLADMPPEDSKRRAVERVNRAGERARDLVRQLLAFGRKQALEVKPVNINEVISGFEKLLRRTIREDIHLRVQLDKSVPTVMADVGQLEQVIMNLAVNAQDAISRDGSLTIETGRAHMEEGMADMPRGVAPGEYALLIVSDTGCGMDAATCKRIFEPFYTTKEKGKGTGLGLATVFGIVKQHGGNIHVTSAPGEGTVFKILLPAAEEAVAPSEAPKILENLRGSETIMVVEDDDNVRELVEAILARQGYEVFSAHSAAECLRLLGLHRGPLHMLLTDVIMPGMNGRELALKVRERYPEVKVVFMSGYTDDVILHRGMLEKGIHFIQKPFSAQYLASRIREVADD